MFFALAADPVIQVANFRLAFYDTFPFPSAIPPAFSGKIVEPQGISLQHLKEQLPVGVFLVRVPFFPFSFGLSLSLLPRSEKNWPARASP